MSLIESHKIPTHGMGKESKKEQTLYKSKEIPLNEIQRIKGNLL